FKIKTGSRSLSLQSMILQRSQVVFTTFLGNSGSLMKWNMDRNLSLINSLMVTLWATLLLFSPLVGSDFDVLLKRNGKLIKSERLLNGLYKFKEGTTIDRVVLDCINSLQNGADLLWIETPIPHIRQIAHLVNQIREVVPDAKLVYNNSPSFNWTLNFLK
ncbi:MAG: hypothetical protein AAF705_12975, partial [Bacteroidota bacterium]